ncbi:hypothetical protein BPAE_0036g00180 [Botrytis paeoniae]|uniref:Uncharacterized protein n=1 Tax=Botrytis paeoniae TaxID=278948 RepID=A0A4Z1G128_9HELO|nr:hypothetical protein BPAE_0036g00180 [Botrytis paeoniae]
MHFLTQTLIAAAFLAGAVFSVPQGIPPNGSGGGDQSTSATGTAANTTPPPSVLSAETTQRRIHTESIVIQRWTRRI